MAQLINITSEALQATIRRLLPSQQGFGEDLQATNVVTPIIDLTPTAEGSSVPTYLQSALTFGSQTSFDAAGSTVTIANTPGFYRVLGVINVADSTVGVTGNLSLSDGLGSKKILEFNRQANGGPFYQLFDFTIFLPAGHSATATTSDSSSEITGSTRQVATVTGELVNPNGFNPQ